MQPFGVTDGAEDREAILKRMAKMERWEKKKMRDQEDMNATVLWMCAIGVFHAFTLIVAIFGGSWAWAQFTGSGASMVSIRTSMFMLDVTMECGHKNPIEDYICKALEPVKGNNLISKARAMFSSISATGPTAIVNQIFYSNLVIFFFFTFAAVFHMISASLLYFYWKESPLPKIRQWAQVFWVMAPCCGAMGITLWSATSPNLEELPKSFTQAAGFLTPGNHDIIGFVPIRAMMPYGWCWFWSVWWIFVEICTLTVWPCFFHKHVGEDAAQDEEENAKEWAMQEGLLAYGATDLGDPSAYMYGQQQDPGGFQQPQAPQASQQYPQQYQYQQQGYYQQPQSYQQQPQSYQQQPQAYPQMGYNYGQGAPYQSTQQQYG